jgi:cytochrome c551/c552
MERQHLAEERNQEEQARLDHELEAVLDADEPPEPVPAMTEITDWDEDLENTWINFAPCLDKSGLNQRVAVESLVRYRRAQWIQMTKEPRDLYTVWKNQRYATARPDQVRVRDLIMSPDCLYLPPSHYACPICWMSQTVHKEATAAGMRQHCFKAHSTQAKSCYDPFTLALGKMIGKDVMLQAEWPDTDGGPPRTTTVRGNYLQCYHRGCQHKAVNRVGIRDHLEKQHHSHDSLDMGGWNIILDHLKHNSELKLDDLFEKKSAIVCHAQNCGFVGVMDKALIAHNLQQHQNQEKWTKATLKVQLGVAPPIPNLENPELALADAENHQGGSNLGRGMARTHVERL